MRSKLIALMVVVVTLLAGISLTVGMKRHPIIIVEDSVEELPQKPAKTIESYYPVVKDSVWEYDVKNSIVEDLVVSVDFIKDNVFQLRYKKGGMLSVKVFLMEEDTLYEVATVEDDTVKNDYTLLRQYKDVVLKLPLEKGNTWTLRDGATREITAVDKKIETPLGEIKVIEVTTTHKDYEMVQSYTEKMGLVSISYEAEKEEGELLLKKYLTNHPLKTYIDVYYPNTVKDKIELIRQQVSIMTNEEPRHFLTDVLSSEPKEENIQPLPLDAEINMIYVEEEENTVSVDLSMDYSESKYTLEEEKLAIQSVVKTIGNYYKMGYVKLTVNGEVYRERIKVR